MFIVLQKRDMQKYGTSQDRPNKMVCINLDLVETIEVDPHNFSGTLIVCGYNKTSVINSFEEVMTMVTSLREVHLDIHNDHSNLGPAIRQAAHASALH